MTELDALQHQLDSSDPVERADAVRALGAGGPAAQVGPAIARLLGDADELVRSEAVDVLGELGYAPALDAVRALLRTDRSALVRACAAETIGDLGDPAALADLVGALDDDDDAVRGYAANAVGLLGGAPLIPLLELRLGVEQAPGVRAELHGACYRLGAARALAELIAALDAMDVDLGYNVLNVWEDLIGRHAPPSLEHDTPVIAAALARVARRLPELRGQADALAARLGP